MIDVLPTSRAIPISAWCECNERFLQGLILGGIGTALIIFLVAIILIYIFRIRKDPVEADDG